MSCPNNEATKLKTRHQDTCKENCDFNFKYNSNSICQLITQRDYLEIKTDGKNKVSFNSQELKLDSVRLYIPSLHTFDGKHTDAELILKHDGGQKNFMVCLPIKTSKGIGDSINFFKQIAPYVVHSRKNNPVTVNVKNWSLNNVMPAPKTPFYNYSGDSPYPPCNMKATMIVFDNIHASTINEVDLELIKKTIKKHEKRNKTTSSKEGFVGGVREGMVTYNSAGANNNDTGSQAMECSEYYDTDTSDTNTNTNTNTNTTNKKSTDSSKTIIIVCAVLAILMIVGGMLLAIKRFGGTGGVSATSTVDVAGAGIEMT